MELFRKTQSSNKNQNPISNLHGLFADLILKLPQWRLCYLISITLFSAWAIAGPFWLLNDRFSFTGKAGSLPCINMSSSNGDKVDICSISTPFVLIFIIRNCRNCREVIRSADEYVLNHGEKERLILVVPESQKYWKSKSKAIVHKVLIAPEETWEGTFQIMGTPTLIYVDENLKMVRRQIGRRTVASRIESFRQFFQELEK